MVLRELSVISTELCAFANSMALFIFSAMVLLRADKLFPSAW